MLTIQTDRYTCNKCFVSKPASDFSEMTKALAKAGMHDDVYCMTCITELFNSRVGGDEAVSKLKEENDAQREKFRLPGQEERKRADLRWGRAMHSSELITRLRRLIPSLYVQNGNIPGDLSLYDVRNTRVEYLGYMHEGEMPEFSIVHTDRDDMPVREQRGWRTVLLRLVRAKVLTEQQVNEAFGEPCSGEASRFYREEIHKIRNAK